MSEEKNIPEESSKPQASSDEADAKLKEQKNKQSALDKQETNNQKQATENMETHAHHLHKAPGKNWTHYLFEFLMLFLAVFCGFLAENFREHQVEHQREKQYIKSLIADLKSDQQILSRHILHLKTGLSIMDSVISILNTPSLITGNTGNLYYLARLGPRLNPLSTNSRTFEQLKNSGNFR